MVDGRRTFAAALLIPLLLLAPKDAFPEGSIRSVQVNGWPASSPVELHEQLTITVALLNTGNVAVGPFEIDTSPFPAIPDVDQPLSGLNLAPHASAERIVTVKPNRLGRVDLLIRLRAGRTGEIRTVKIGAVDVTERPTFWQRNRDMLAVILPIVSVVLGALVAVGVQLFLQKRTRREKAAEALSRVVSEQARDYYSTMSGALYEFVKALQDIPQSQGKEQEHLLRRAFFFFGLFTYTENDFSFNQGFLQLPHLWAEEGLTQITRRIFEVIPLSPRSEAVVHKCFSDVVRIHKGHAKDDDSVRFKVRTLWDFEEVLEKARGQMSDLERELADVFEGVRRAFMDGGVIEKLKDYERVTRAIIEYEVTQVFKEWYRGATRRLPSEEPGDFSGIAGETADWETVKRILDGK